MAMDTPAKIAVLGAGPIGLEAALYARFLGYDVEVFERGEVADSVRRWGHVRMFTPFGLNRSSLALAALCAQDEQFDPPGDDEFLTGEEWIERFLLPLAKTDLLRGHIRTKTEVLSVGRTHWLKAESPGDAKRGDDGFQILYRTGNGAEGRANADIVIDCSGVFAVPNWLGPGGTPALGEMQLRGEIEYGVPDVLGCERRVYQGKRTLVVGSGYSAATTVVSLANLLEQSEQDAATDVSKTGSPGELLWLTRPASDAEAPIAPIADDRLPLRDELGRKANQLAQSDSIRKLTGVVQQIRRVGDRFEVDILTPADVSQTDGEQDPTNSCQSETVDCIVANIGYRGDWAISEELQIHRCYATDGPIKLAASLLATASSDCLDQTAIGVEALISPEANFYLLGVKSYGRSSRFLFARGLDQIRDLFSLIGERSTLDLYAGAKTLPS
jgi:hypothetical protein